MSNYIWPIDRALSGATTLGQSGPGSNGNEGILYIPQISSITGVSPSNCLVSYTGHSLEGWFLPLCRDAVGVSYPSWLGYSHLKQVNTSDLVAKKFLKNLCIKLIHNHFKQVETLYLVAISMFWESMYQLSYQFFKHYTK